MKAHAKKIALDEVPHPGKRIKAEVIPQGMSVTKAAELIGVGRPALSNLLNGKAALSPDMAARLEMAFNYPRKDLLEMQAEFDATQAKKNSPSDTKAYVPPFLGIKANHIEQWVSHNVAARTRLSVFLRTLVNSTGRALAKVDFPGNDDAERPGWDGFVEAREGTPWVPEGRSGWEFGTNEDIKTKADNDFNKSVRALEPKERKEITFVFVTPRRWLGKAAWIKAAKEKGICRDVRAYDASDLEQWLEQSLPAQAWFANETQISTQDVRSLDKCWTDWANVSTPPLPGSLFSTAIDAAKRTMLARLPNPPDGPTVIAADSTEEAVAFLAQLFGERGGEELAVYRDKVMVFDKPGVMPRLSQGAQTFIPVAYTREVERELAPYAKAMHSIVVYPRNAVNIEAHIILEPITYDTFNKALEEMGKGRDEISRLANGSGRSLTVLRRRVATVPAVQMPEWAANHKTAESLVPFFFVGTWHSENNADKTALSLLANDRPYPELEKESQNLSQLNDAPIWSIGAVRGVVSKIDLLYAIARIITADDLNRFFSIARLVLKEDDPSLDFKDDEIWIAPLRSKTREFSSGFRKGISETLVLLAVHGRNLFSKHLGFDTEAEARQVVRDLLPSPLTTRILEANDHDLPTYAEAAPKEFLTILEHDLKQEKPAVLGLLRPAEPGVFGRAPRRTGLLWALEGLSWNPETLPQSAFILARLAQVEIKDNWVNKPAHSLQAIFRAWMPQTAASHEARVGLMKKLAERFPKIAWKICVSQFGNNHDVGDYSHKPRWRTDGYGFGEPFSTTGPIFEFQREMVEMALAWKEHDLGTLSDLVERLPYLDDQYQIRVWTLIETWANTKASESEKASMREKIRVSVFSRRAAMLAKKSPNITTRTDKAKAVFAALEPSDLLNKHAWLFQSAWVDESADEIEDIENLDYEKREQRIQEMRIAAMQEIFNLRGIPGIMALAEQGKVPGQIGWYAAKDLLSEEELVEFMRLALQRVIEDKDGAYSFKNLIAGAARALFDGEKLERVLKTIATGLSEKDMVQLLLLAPFGKTTWNLVDPLGEEAQAEYWVNVAPDWIRNSDGENNEGIERLLKAERPRAAFKCVRIHLEKVDPQVLFRLLSKMANGGNDRTGEYLLEPHEVGEAFEHLDKSPMLTLEQKAGLEFTFLDALSEPMGKGTPNLERYLEAHPELFVQAVVWLYKRKDGGTDPVNFQVSPDRQEEMGVRGYKLLDAIKRIPGHDDLGELKADRLSKWIATVRQGCAELSRSEIGDECIGKLLANAPIGEDGVWPCEVVRQAIEDIESEPLMRGMQIGVYNSRGVHWRGEGGNQERELADKYRKWAQALQVSHPYVSSNLLMELAKWYEREASREDLEAGLRRRLLA